MNENMIALKMQEKQDGVSISIKVRPKSSRSRILGSSQGSLVVSLCSAPSDGEANEELISILSKEFKTPKSSIQILTGLRNRNKVIKINGISMQTLLTWSHECQK